MSISIVKQEGTSKKLQDFRSTEILWIGDFNLYYQRCNCYN